VFVVAVLASPFKSKIRLEAENATLRHQLVVLRRRLKGRARLTNNDRWFFVQMYRCFPSILKVVTIVQPETLVRWHRAGFRCYWRWKSRQRGGRENAGVEGVQRIVPAAPRPESVGEPEAAFRLSGTLRRASTA
jgi:ribosomal protein L34